MTIRSFARTNGRLTEAQQTALLHLLPQYAVSVSESVLNFETLFSNTQPVILEIGFGMGHTLLQLAVENPQNNYLGVEIYKPGIATLVKNIALQKINNLRIFPNDIQQILDQAIPNTSLSACYIFFPDPWPKRRHHKRRLIQTAFLNKLSEKLKIDGILHIATDDNHYAKHILDTCLKQPQLSNTSPAGNYCPRPSNRPYTKYEQRGEGLGYQIFDIIFRKYR